MSPQASVRRGPTLRGGRFRPPIGRNSLIQRRNSTSSDEEEKLGLTENIELSEKFEADQEEKPHYHHGEETFGDIITHPIEEYNAHKHRKEEYQHQVDRWSHQPDHRTIPPPMATSTNTTSTNTEMAYIIIIHFRQLKGNQSFALDHDSAVDFAQRVNLTPKEKILFNGVHDTDGLTDFLYKIKRDFSIKIHNKADSTVGHQQDHTHHAEHHTIEFNDNCFIEFKPKHNHHHELSSKETRRPFFQYPEPDLSADIGEETAASWLELFYDLFYVATLSEFTHSHHIKDWASLGLYTEWFVITWWAWCASSLYTARFDTDDVVHHIYKLVEMCAVVGMAGSSEYFLSSRGYVYGYIALKAILVIEYSVVFIVALLAKSKSRMALSCYIGANLISIALWAGSLTMIDNDIHRVLWYLGVLCELLVNVIIRGDKTLSWAASHLAERLGLLTLIVLGENLMGLVGLVATAGTSVIIVLPNFMAVAIIFGFFFMYFEDFNKEVFLHNKYHQIWVYLHFPLHLCQVAFGISLIDILKIYKFQLIRDNKLKEEESTTEHNGTEASSSSTTGASESSHTASESTHGTSESNHATSESTHTTSESNQAETSESATSATHNAKRAIQLVSDVLHQDTTDYNPVVIANTIQNDTNLSSQHHRSTWCKYIASSIAYAALQTVTSYYCEDRQLSSSSSSHLTRRSEAASEDGSFAGTVSNTEIVFVYKTFLIFGGLILIINSIIKAINTRIADIYGKIIIASRVINAIVLWSLCALPFAQLDAIVLLSTMVGSLIFQALVDLLD
ncbi:hypothetical protein RO3G_12135 [Rhizopus delemar RA 99-880]|uniref:Bacterial low temperature requirement A protein-domain-containing protein n=3 Tax=Rhizopus TaxID=4842 RepID=I1CG44_RHIO9|nr:hypothetical protein RO3G_12135 [Rhizopus delemar RA 99-880]|eukprot:EIE87424.1 hypothetical protein RO3G_12135 [Rhizopus delemar RA 99-880]